MPEMKTLIMGGDSFEIVDASARSSLAAKADKSALTTEVTARSDGDTAINNKIGTGTLNTTAKTIIPAINEVKSGLASTVKTFTLSASSWSDGQYTISDSLVTASSNQEVIPALNITADEMSALSSAIIVDGGQSAGKMILKALGDIPTIDVPIRVIFRGDK